MRITDLDPRWLYAADGVTKIGFAFNCPTRFSPEKQHRQSCMFQPTPRHDQWESWRRSYPELETRDWCFFQGCNPAQQWRCTPMDFATMTVTPSLDGSAGGNWHGFITNGEIVGGL